MKPVIVYCAKYIGGKEPVLAPTDVGFRACEVRESVGKLYNMDDPVAGWKIAKKNGWRVEPCILESQSDWLLRERRSR